MLNHIFKDQMNFKDSIRNTETALNKFFKALFPLNCEDVELWSSPEVLTELSIGNSQGIGIFRYRCGQMTQPKTTGFPHYFACAFHEFKQYLVQPNAVGMSLEDIQAISLTIKPTYEHAIEVFRQNAKNMGLDANLVKDILKTFRSSFDEAWCNWTPEKIDVKRFNKVFPSVDPLKNPDEAAEKIHNLLLTRLKGGVGEKIDISYLENLSDKLYLNVNPSNKIKKGSILEQEFYDLQQNLSANYSHIVLAAALARVIAKWQHPIKLAPDCVYRIYQDYEGNKASFLLDFSEYKEYPEFKVDLINGISATPEERLFFDLLSTLDGTINSGASMALMDNELAFIRFVADKAKLNLFE